VKDEHEVLENGHGSTSVDVGDEDDKGNGPDAESALPVGRGVFGVVFSGQRLDQSSNQERTTGCSGLPTQSDVLLVVVHVIEISRKYSRRHPTGKVRQPSLVLNRRKFTDPMVLSWTSSFSTSSTSHHLKIFSPPAVGAILAISAKLTTTNILHAKVQTYDQINPARPPATIPW
jgi:hypothetical protein